jgi:hypothetical protein
MAGRWPSITHSNASRIRPGAATLVRTDATLAGMALSPFLARFGFNADPFESWDAETEPDLDEYFVPPPYFDSVLGDSERPVSQVILAPRGGGKTAQRRMVEAESRKKGRFLCVTYDEFDEPAGGKLAAVTWGYHVNQICRRILLGIMIQLDEDDDLANRLSDHQKQLLKYEIPKYLGTLSAAEHEAALKSLKNFGERSKDFVKRHAGPIAIAINAVMKKLGLDNMSLPSDLPEEAKVDESLRYHYLHLLKIAKAVGFDSTYVLIDRVDEIHVTGDAKSTYNFVEPLLNDLRTLDAPGVAIKFFLWDQIEAALDESSFRRDRVAVHSLRWTLEELQEMLARRLSAYSNGTVSSFNDLLCPDFAVNVHELLSHFGAGSPRDMIRCAKRIVAEETRVSIESTCMSQAAVWSGLRLFSEERTGELLKPEYLAELRKVGKPTFTISYIGSDVFRITNEGARRKIQVWTSTATVAKIDELPNQKDRPTHLFGVTDLRVAVAMLSTTDLELILGNYVLACPSCKAMSVSDRKEISCPACQARFTLAANSETLLSRVGR